MVPLTNGLAYQYQMVIYMASQAVIYSIRLSNAGRTNLSTQLRAE